MTANQMTTKCLLNGHTGDLWMVVQPLASPWSLVHLSLTYHWIPLFFFSCCLLYIVYV